MILLDNLKNYLSSLTYLLCLNTRYDELQFSLPCLKRAELHDS